MLFYFLRPIHFFQTYKVSNLRFDLVAGLTVAVILLPQAITYALVAELPTQAGLYTAIVAAIVGALWGSSNHLQTGPTNTASLLVLSILLPIAAPGTPTYLAGAALLAIMVGFFRLVMGLARLGFLVNFVSDSVIVGFAAGVGVLISVNQVRYLFRLEFPSSPSLINTFQNLFTHLSDMHWPSLVLGLGTILLIVWLKRLNPKLPGPLISIVVSSTIVGILGPEQLGVKVIGLLPQSLPPLVFPPLFDLDLIRQLSTGALAVGVIGLVEAMSIARSIAAQTNQHLDSNQEFVGQGLANIICGFLVGSVSSGSFARSAINYKAGGQTPLANIFSGLFVLLVMMTMAPLAAYLPRTALAGVLIIAAYDMIDRREIVRIWHSTRGDTIIMVVTLITTLFLPLQFALLTGVLFSFARYILKTSVPQVDVVGPDDNFKHFVLKHPHQPSCPQLGVIKISGDLYFGAVRHIEEIISQHLADHPEQQFLLLRMQEVNQCDMSGIHMLEAILQLCQERNGGLFLMRVQNLVLTFMQTTGFYDKLGADHFLAGDYAIDHLFYKVLDPSICIYECDVRVFAECQNLPRPLHPVDIPLHITPPANNKVANISPERLWQMLHSDRPPIVIDVRESREFQRGHIPQAKLVPLPKLLTNPLIYPTDTPIVFVCRSGRRSTRAVIYISHHQGYRNLQILQGGMVAWEAAGLLEAVEQA